ncbi:MAG: fatty acid desaturase [Polyangiales bacterium]
MEFKDIAHSSPRVETTLDRVLATLINDERDLPFVYLILQCLAVALLGVGLFFVPAQYFWYAAPIYWVIVAFGVLDRFILMLHCTSHRTLFKKERAWMNQIIPWVIGPFMGESPETYFAHHMGMHHPENNLPEDLSSTMKYQRDSLADWLTYYVDFLLFGLARLVGYHKRKHNPKLLLRTIVGEGSFLLVAGGLCLLNWRASMAVFLIPLVIVRFLMMAGNWGQHAFVDAADPGNAYKNSITCINSRYNRRAFNDGYHIHHHVKARTHWTELPAEFRDNLETYAREDAIVFEGIDFFMVWAYLMLGQWKTLAKHFVHIPGAPERDEAAVIAFLKSRVQRIDVSNYAAA